jgi:hypothetical protein
MSHRRTRSWPALGLALLVPAVGCLVSGNGEPGPAFDNGGRHRPSGGAGTSGGGHVDGGTDASQDAVGDVRHEVGSDVGNEVGEAGNDASVADGDAGAKPSACAASAAATFTFAWTIEDATGVASTCAAQAGQTVDVDIVDLSTGAESLMTVPCAGMTVTSCTLPGGNYSVSMKLRNAAGTVLAEVDAPMLFLPDGETTPVAAVPFEVGGADATNGRGFSLTWSIENAGSLAAETCAQASAATVRLVAGAKTFDLTCADGKGRTTALAPGDYPVTIHLLSASGAELSVTQSMTLHVVAGQLLFLGNVVFDVI